MQITNSWRVQSHANTCNKIGLSKVPNIFGLTLGMHKACMHFTIKQVFDVGKTTFYLFWVHL